MMETVSKINEEKAALAFTRQSVVFDDLFSTDTIIQYKRKRVRDHMSRYLQPNSYILELNSGTGEDAVYFAQQGHYIHATDISAGMQEMLKKKVEANTLQKRVSNELCSFTELAGLKNKGPYDAIFSNFAGLNCTNELDKVLSSFNDLLKPGGIVTLVIMPKFCLWESLLLFKGKWKTATRRFFSRNGSKAHIEGQYFKCWYYNPGFVIQQLQPNFNVLSVEGLCTIVPPSYMHKFAEKYPRIFKMLVKYENTYKCRWPWKYSGDYYIISLIKKGSN